MAKTDIEKLIAATLINGADFLEKELEVIKLSPSLNYMFGGGITASSMTLFSGPPKLGKTATCFDIARQAQKVGYHIVYLNAEHRVQNRDVASTYGFEPSELSIHTSSPEKIIYAEDFVKLGRYYLEKPERHLIIIDSFSQMCPKDLGENPDFGDKYRDGSPGIFSRFTKVIAPILSVTDNIVLGVTHTYANTSGQGQKTKIEGGGNKIQYSQNFKLEGLYAKAWEDKVGNKIGQEIFWRCKNSSIGTGDREATGYLRFNHGLDYEREILELAKMAAVPDVSLKGAWWQIFDQKAQGTENAVELLRKDPELYRAVDTEVWKVLG